MHIPGTGQRLNRHERLLVGAGYRRMSGSRFAEYHKPRTKRGEVQRHIGAAILFLVGSGELSFTRHGIPKFRCFARHAKSGGDIDSQIGAAGGEINFRIAGGAMDIIQGLVIGPGKFAVRLDATLE